LALRLTSGVNRFHAYLVIEATNNSPMIRCRATLRWLVIVEILLTVVTVTVSFIETSFLPPTLQQFEREASENVGITDIVLLCLAFPLLILFVIAWVLRLSLSSQSLAALHAP
jgi:hypothetical protein